MSTGTVPIDVTLWLCVGVEQPGGGEDPDRRHSLVHQRSDQGARAQPHDGLHSEIPPG